MPDPIEVELDTSRQLVFNHTTIVKMDDELERRYDTNFQEFAITAAQGFHFGALIVAYKWAMRPTEGRMKDAEVANVLDNADLDFEDLLLNLVRAHPYMELEADDDTSLTAGGDNDPTPTLGEET